MPPIRTDEVFPTTFEVNPFDAALGAALRNEERRLQRQLQQQELRSNLRHVPIVVPPPSSTSMWRCLKMLLIMLFIFKLTRGSFPLELRNLVLPLFHFTLLPGLGWFIIVAVG